MTEPKLETINARQDVDIEYWFEDGRLSLENCDRAHIAGKLGEGYIEGGLEQNGVRGGWNKIII